MGCIYMLGVKFSHSFSYIVPTYIAEGVDLKIIRKNVQNAVVVGEGPCLKNK